MKVTLTVLTLVSSLVLSSAAALAQAASADGVVKKIDTSANKITIQHGPIPALDMPDSMTMVYRVKEPSVLKNVKTGDKVKFEADRENGGLTVTSIQKAK